jgi:hypothetical protein
MSDDNMQPTETDQPKQTELEQAGQQTEQSQGSTTAQPARPGHRLAPGRRPLFGS